MIYIYIYTYIYIYRCNSQCPTAQAAISRSTRDKEVATETSGPAAPGSCSRHVWSTPSVPTTTCSALAVLAALAAVAA